MAGNKRFALFVASASLAWKNCSARFYGQSVASLHSERDLKCPTSLPNVEMAIVLM